VTRELPTGTVTFLFTDVEGSTRLLEELGATAYADALGEHRVLVRDALAKHGGAEVDTQGDAFFCAFPSARSAVACATDIRDALARTPIRVRMGVHTGEALLVDGHYVGLDVHRAARIGACGHGGQVVISGEAKAVAAACEAAKAAGAKRALPLAVSAPFHCALMAPAADRLAPELRAIPQGPFAFPVVANVTAAPYGAGDVVAGVLIRQITAPVRWEESVVAMRAAGADAFLEVGPGKVLSGLIRRIEKDAATSAFCGPADLDGARGLIA